MSGISKETYSEDYYHLFVNDIPLIDLRSPIEFTQGAFPNAVNMPLMEDSERESVGICYRQYGQEAAIKLGHQLISGEIRQTRITAWVTQCHYFPHGYLYCLRGGLRSHIVQQWLSEAGVAYPLVKGGYKALRHYLLQVIEQVAQQPMILVGGKTGCGKTQMLCQFNAALDLEGLAYHRGSSFGRTLIKQSSQIDFENRLAISLLKKQQQRVPYWILEDEGRVLGSNHLPLRLYQHMQQAPVVVVEEPFMLRVKRLQQDYIDLMQYAFRQAYGEALGWQNYVDHLHQGLFAIRRRLGIERFMQLHQRLEQALSQQRINADSDGHLTWLIPLLQEYYDPMYQYQLEKKADRIVFRGNYTEVKDYLVASNRIDGD